MAKFVNIKDINDCIENILQELSDYHQSEEYGEMANLSDKLSLICNMALEIINLRDHIENNKKRKG